MDIKQYISRIGLPALFKGRNSEVVDKKAFHYVPDEVAIYTEEVESRDVMPYIKGKSEGLFGDDYYSGYMYEDGKLTFVTMQSRRHLEGKPHVFIPAMVIPGSYEINANGRWYLIENNGETVSCNIAYGHTPGSIDLLSEDLPDSYPSTLRLQWSLAKKSVPINMMMGGVAVLAMAWFALQSLSYDSAAKETIRKNRTSPESLHLKPLPVKRMPDMSRTIRNASKMVGPGIIRQVRYDGKQVTVIAKMRDESAARSFIAVNGGNYQDGLIQFVMPQTP